MMRDANIVTLYKNRPARRDCSNNYQGIEFPSIAIKLFARVVVKGLQVLAERFYPESWCGFSAKRSILLAELWRAKRACGAPWVSKSTHPRKFGNHVTVHRPQPARPSVRTTGIPIFTLTLSSQVLSSYFGSPGES